MATAALTVAHPADLRVTTIRESTAALPDERWVAEVVATLRRLRAEKALDLDNILCVVHGCFTYFMFGGVVHLPTTAVAFTVNRSHAITVEVERPTPRREGVLVSYGGHGGGFTFRVRDNRLTYDYYCAGALYTISSDREIPVGTSSLRFVFTKTGHLQGTGTLFINGEQVGQGRIPHILPYLIPSEGPDARPNGTGVASRHEMGGSPTIGRIKVIMISSADNPEPLPATGSVVFRTE
jgi:hypothetical protein